MKNERMKVMLDYLKKEKRGHFCYNQKTEEEHVNDVIGCFLDRVLRGLNESFPGAHEDNKYYILSKLYEWLVNDKTYNESDKCFMEFLAKYNNVCIADDCGSTTFVKPVLLESRFDGLIDLHLKVYCSESEEVDNDGYSYNIRIRFHECEDYLDGTEYFSKDSIIDKYSDDCYEIGLEFDIQKLENVDNFFKLDSMRFDVDEPETFIAAFKETKQKLKNLINNYKA